MVLGDLALWKLLNDLVRDPEPDPDLVQPASIDVRVGREMLVEVGPGEFRPVDLSAGPVELGPGELATVPTLEWLTVPNGYAVELRLKAVGESHGLAQSTAVWLEPGWCGVATLELRNVTRHTPVRLQCGMRLAHLVVHALDQPAVRPHRWTPASAPDRHGR
jgi:deoxycytidine triphosphate deaminase